MRKIYLHKLFYSLKFMDKKDKEMTLINKVGRAIWGKVIGKTIEFISVTGMLGYTLFLYEKGNLNA